VFSLAGAIVLAGDLPTMLRVVLSVMVGETAILGLCVLHLP